MVTPSPGGRFGAVVTAMVTPFTDDGALDVDGAVTLARWLTDHGSDGLVVAGTTGEGSVLTDEEKLTLWAAVAEAVTVPVVVGAGSNDTAHSVALAARAAAVGAAGVLVVTPYYNRPSQHGIRQHVTAVAEATSLPVMLYDIPVRTGRRVEPDTTLELARTVANVVALKDASGDITGAARLVADAPAGFEVYSGDDAATLPLLAVGAVGVVSVAAHWIGPQMRAMVAAFAAGDVVGARHRNAELLAAMAFQGSERHPNPLPAKAMCRALGLPSGQCRLPMGPASADLDEAARRLAADLGYTEVAGPARGDDGRPVVGAARTPAGGSGG